jgi:hypothetical protein
MAYSVASVSSSGIDDHERLAPGFARRPPKEEAA